MPSPTGRARSGDIYAISLGADSHAIVKVVYVSRYFTSQTLSFARRLPRIADSFPSWGWTAALRSSLVSAISFLRSRRPRGTGGCRRCARPGSKARRFLQLGPRPSAGMRRARSARL